MSEGTNATEGVNREGQKEDVVSEKITRDGRGSGGDAGSVDGGATSELSELSHPVRSGSGIRCSQGTMVG